MPRIIEYQQQTSAEGAIQGRRADAADSAGFGAGLELLGGAVSNVADVMQDTANRQEVSTVQVELAQTRAQWSKHLAERAAAGASDPDFSSKFAGDLSAHLGQLEGKLQTRAGQDAFRRGAGELSAHFLERAGLHQVAAAGAKAKQDYVATLDAYRNTLVSDPAQFEGVMRAAEDALNDPNGQYARMPAAVREQLTAQTRRELALSAVDGAIRLSPTEARGQLIGGAWDSFLDADHKSALLKQADAAIEKQDAQRKAQTAEANAAATSDLEIAVRRGQAGYGQIEAAFKAGTVTPAKRTELTVYLDTERRKAAEKANAEREALGRVQAAIDGRGFLDPRTEKDRKAVDDYYSKVFAPAMKRSNMDPAAASQAAVDFSARTGIVPSPLRQAVRGALRAGTPDDKAKAADMLDRLKTANPAVIDDFSDADIALGNTVSTYVRAGIPAPKAVELAERNLDVPSAEREARRTRYREDKAPEKNQKRLSKDLTGFRFFEANMPGGVPDALAGEFELLTREEFVRSGDLEGAQATALDHLKRVWGVTRTGGSPQWMKYAPETVYAVPGENGDWIRKQLTAEVSKNALFDGKPDLSLAADSLTAREAEPSYVVLNRRNGALEPLRGADGRPLRFRPDYANSEAGKSRQAALAADRAEAEKVLKAGRAVSGVIRRPDAQATQPE